MNSVIIIIIVVIESGDTCANDNGLDIVLAAMSCLEDVCTTKQNVTRMFSYVECHVNATLWVG